MTSSSEEYQQIEAFVHRGLHLMARRGVGSVSDEVLITDCWDVPFTHPPDWAVQAQEAAEPPATWCPKITPSLWEKAGEQAPPDW